MKSFFSILKIILLVVLLVGLAFGYLFFRVWQKNERPTASNISWGDQEILLGHQSTLNFTITTPWHRELVTASPSAYPDFLVPLPDKATLVRRGLNFSGEREWVLSVPFVATDIKSIDGLTATFPVKSTKRISPNSVTVALPELKIISPSGIPEEPHNPQSFLTEEKPPEEPSVVSENESKKSPWLWAFLALLLIPLVIYVLKRTGVIKSTPPWEKALSKLDQLDTKAEPVAFYSKLTDILKQYTSERYSVRARAKTSAEFIRTLEDLPHVPDQYLTELPSFAKLADAVKFADHVPHATEAPKSLELLRSFVNATTPEPNSDSDSTK